MYIHCTVCTYSTIYTCTCRSNSGLLILTVQLASILVVCLFICIYMYMFCLLFFFPLPAQLIWMSSTIIWCAMRLVSLALSQRSAPSCHHSLTLHHSPFSLSPIPLPLLPLSLPLPLPLSLSLSLQYVMTANTTFTIINAIEAELQNYTTNNVNKSSLQVNVSATIHRTLYM